MRQVLVAQGKVSVHDVPAPVVEPGTVLVRVTHSCISIGTELSGVRASALPLWKRAMRQPDKVKSVLRDVRSNGLRQTWEKIETTVSAPQPTGYSAVGTVLEVGEGVTDLVPGERVGCAGAQFAHHADVIRVPRNLVVPVPDGVPSDEASTLTLGAIAMQGVRRATPTLGENFVVVGLGVLGQLTTQLLAANGCRAIGLDVDRSRVDRALGLGMYAGVHHDDGDVAEQVARVTDGLGADGVIITAASPSSELVSLAFRMCRKKGRVVIVGDVGLDLNRADFYAKEIDLLISSSYGPGRYDRAYEERGLDYPAAYVRWTENRNLSEFLRLLADEKIQVKPLISDSYKIDDAEKAYAALQADPSSRMIVLLEYPETANDQKRLVENPRSPARARSGKVRVGLIGAGGFAKAVHLPNMRALSDLFELHAVASRTGHNATATANAFGARYSTTEDQRIIEDPDIDAVIIATRHDQHARLTLAALEAGKHVLCEKPLGVSRAELASIEAFYAGNSQGTAPILLTGFNRRFSVYGRALSTMLSARTSPAMFQYRMNAGRIPNDSWLHAAEGGGRNIGEASHIYDFFTFLTGSRVKEVSSASVQAGEGHYRSDDNFTATMTFDDGSVATLAYTAMGASDYPKESLDVFYDGKVATLVDYKELSVAGAKVARVSTAGSSKGQREELEAFGRAIRDGSGWPSPLWQQLQAMEIAFRVEEGFTR